MGKKKPDARSKLTSAPEKFKPGPVIKGSINETGRSPEFAIYNANLHYRSREISPCTLGQSLQPVLPTGGSLPS